MCSSDLNRARRCGVAGRKSDLAGRRGDSQSHAVNARPGWSEKRRRYSDSRPHHAARQHDDEQKRDDDGAGHRRVAAEGLISSYCEGFGFQGYIFRFVSILGERYTHGHVFDFYRKLRDDPSTLEVLGNGKQRKSYLYIQDCIDAILIAIERAEGKVNIFNLGTDDSCRVMDSIGWITARLGVQPALDFTGGDKAATDAAFARAADPSLLVWSEPLFSTWTSPPSPAVPPKPPIATE